MRFTSNNSCDIVKRIVNKNWNFLNDQESIEFSNLAQQYHIKYMSSTYVTNEQRQICLDNFNNIKNINSLYLQNTLEHATLDQDMSVAYINRGKEKTIVAISGSSWLLALSRNAIEHQYSWMFDEFTDYNIISIVEDVKRSQRNPVLFDSCMYKGINDNIDSIEKVATYIKDLIPNTEYNIVSDCKNGHSSCLLAEKLNASKVLIQSGSTTSSPMYAEDKIHDIEEYFHIAFELSLRNLAFCKEIPSHLRSINNIAKAMPDTQFTYVHHVNDVGFKSYIDLVDDSIANITKVGIESTSHTYSDHYITLELRRSGFFVNYFKDLI